MWYNATAKLRRTVYSSNAVTGNTAVHRSLMGPTSCDPPLLSVVLPQDPSHALCGLLLRFWERDLGSFPSPSNLRFRKRGLLITIHPRYTPPLDVTTHLDQMEIL